MKIPWVIALCLAAGGISGFIGHRMGVKSASAETPLAEVASHPSASEPDPFASQSPASDSAESGPTDDEIEMMLAEMAEEADAAETPQFDEERMRRWENMSMEQRRMLRKSMFSALAKVDGLEEVGDAIRQGKIDPRQFNLNPEAIADRMEFYAESMDQQAMEEEVTKSLQDIVNQARSQMNP